MSEVTLELKSSRKNELVIGRLYQDIKGSETYPACELIYMGVDPKNDRRNLFLPYNELASKIYLPDSKGLIGFYEVDMYEVTQIWLGYRRVLSPEFEVGGEYWTNPEGTNCIFLGRKHYPNVDYYSSEFMPLGETNTYILNSVGNIEFTSYVGVGNTYVGHMWEKL